MRRRRSRSNKNPYSVSREPELWNDYNEELIDMKESLFIDKWHDTCEILPDSDDVWFISGGKICVGVYEPEQKIFCMADGLGVELKDVRQWKYVGINKQIAKFPKEKQVIAVSLPGLPCLATGIFSDHLIDEDTLDEVSGVVLDWDLGVVPYNQVSYWYEIPEEPLVVLEPVGDAPLAVMPSPEVFVPNEVSEGECEDCGDPEDTSPDQALELGDRSMESDDVKSSIAKSKMAVSGSEDLEEDPIKKGTLRESGDNKREKDKIKPWYRAAYPTDELGEELDPDVTFKDVYDGLKDGEDVYEVLGVGDSIVRERIFEEMTSIFGLDYDDIYYTWLYPETEYDRGKYTHEEEDPSDSPEEDEEHRALVDEVSKSFEKAINKEDLYNSLYDSIKIVGEGLEESKKKNLKESKIYYDLTDGTYQPWSGAVDTWNTIVDNDKLDDLDRLLDELYPEGLSETGLNDLLWFDSDWIFESLGISSDEDEEDLEEDYEEEDLEEKKKTSSEKKLKESIRGNTKKFIDNVIDHLNSHLVDKEGWKGMEADLLGLMKYGRPQSLNQAIREYVEGGSLDVYYNQVSRTLNKLYENTPEEIEKWEKYPDDKKWDRYINIMVTYIPRAFKKVMGRDLGDLTNEEIRESLDKFYVKKRLSERGLTRSERHNRNMDRILGYKKKINNAQKDFLLSHGVSPEEVEELEKKDQLQTKLIDLGLKDEFYEGFKEKMKESLKRMKEDYGWEVPEDRVWDLYEEMLEAFGAENLLESLVKALGTYELADNLAYICRMNDFDSEIFHEDDEEEEDLEEKVKRVQESKSDGWPKKVYKVLKNVLDDCYNVSYEVKNCIRGVYTNVDTIPELAEVARTLGREWKLAASDLEYLEDEDIEEDEEDL